MRPRWIVVLPAVLLMIMTGFSAGKYPSEEPGNSRGDIIFSHTTHVREAEIECLTCHEQVEESGLAGDNLLPSMDLCGNCHDVEDADGCGDCHTNKEEPGGYSLPDRSIVFSHAAHLSRKAACTRCHDGIGTGEKPETAYLPDMRQCMECHNGLRADNDCRLCHGDRITLSDIHPADWRRSHGYTAPFDRKWCGQCHRLETFCLDCHRGDNVLGTIHDLNYVFTHGLDAKSKDSDCRTCHDRKAFCNACHESENRIPLLHSSLSWLSDHGRAARRDPENCASCHEADSPTCARSGCHRDSDGLRGTDPRIHPRDMTLFNSHGPWHNDEGYFCYQCHTYTGSRGDGFCGYCHH